MDYYFNLCNRKLEIMNTDHVLVLMGLIGIAIGFLLGYAKGHEHGKIAGRIAYRKTQRQLEQVGR